MPAPPLAPPLARPADVAPAPVRSRLPAIDAARGVALLAMVGYHALWDLGHLRLTADDHALGPAGRAAAHAIAGTFLLLVGVGLVLMNGRGLRPRPFLLRLARVGGAALLVTLATRIAFPDAYVFFGVLHCIAVSSVLGVLFLALPPAATALTAAAVVAVPFLLGLPGLGAPAPDATWLARPPWLDAPELAFLGLGAIPPRTNDYVPLFPWFGLVLAGIALGRLALPRLSASRLGAWAPRSALARAATRLGRHSLAVYLVHQPVLLALLSGLVWIVGPNPRAGLRAFRADFVATCARTGGTPDVCRVAARCTAEALVREDLFRDDGRPFTLAERARAQTLSRACYAAIEGVR